MNRRRRRRAVLGSQTSDDAARRLDFAVPLETGPIGTRARRQWRGRLQIQATPAASLRGQQVRSESEHGAAQCELIVLGSVPA